VRERQARCPGQVRSGRSWFVVNRYIDAKPNAITPQIKNATRLRSGGANEYSVSVSGNKGTFAINGQKVTDFTGPSPDHGSVFGFLVSAHQDHPSTFVLRNLQLREVTAAQP
jgi:hypothetical protein